MDENLSFKITWAEEDWAVVTEDGLGTCDSVIPDVLRTRDAFTELLVIAATFPLSELLSLTVGDGWILLFPAKNVDKLCQN